MRALFLADAHLCRPTDNNYQALLSFLAEETDRTELLVFLGDIFEFWSGHQTKILDVYQPLLGRLDKMVENGTQLVYVEGNHDFHLDPYFSKRFGCRVLPDGGAIQIDDKRVFLAHGDQANPEDRGYRLLRAFLRSGFIKALMRALPPQLVEKIAFNASNRSREEANDKSRRWPARDILIPYARKLLSDGHDIVVTGHFHQAFHETTDFGDLIALGDWITQYSYAVYEDGRFSLETYRPETSSSP